MKKFLCFLIILIVLGGVAVSLLPLEPFSEDKVEFVVRKGEGSREIGYNLELGGLIRSAPMFRIYVISTGASQKLQAGQYLLSSSMSMIEIVKKFTTGDIQKETITIVEGWNFRDIAWYFEGQGMFQAEELFELAGFPAVDYRQASDFPLPKDFADDYDFLRDKPLYVGLEGYLFPDTYEIVAGETLEAIVRKMLSNFQEKFDAELRQAAQQQGKSIFEVITLASLLEKEVQSFEDKRMVAGVLQKRLEAGMALQVDATVSYITGKQTVNVSLEDTTISSPFNTYKYPGLPLGPIANPGLESIKAVLSPADNPFWYYLSTPTGETIFSRTLKEHNIAKARYLK